MGFQTAVAINQASGVVGEIALEGPVRARPAVLKTSDATLNIFGRALCQVADSDTDVVVGGTTPFAGILAFPKEHASYGTGAGGPLAPTTTLPSETTVSAVYMTTGIFVNMTTAANIGDDVCYVNATGELLAVAPGAAAGTGNTKIPGAHVVRNDLSAAGLAIISLLSY